MKLSAFNENYLKNKLNEDDNVGAIQELTERIEGMEKDMYEELNTGYLHVINKCSKLERLSNYIKNVQNTNQELLDSTQELMLRIGNTNEKKDVHDRAIKRLGEVKHEFGIVKHFIKCRNEFSNLKHNNPVTKVVYFKVVSNLKDMENMLSYFKKYNFYMPLNQIYREMYTQFITNIKDKLHDWIINLNYVEIGENIEVLEYRNKIFDTLQAYRSHFITKKFLQCYYAAKELSIEPLVVETINMKRLEVGFAFVKANYKSEEVKGTMESILGSRASINNNDQSINSNNNQSINNNSRSNQNLNDQQNLNVQNRNSNQAPNINQQNLNNNQNNGNMNANDHPNARSMENEHPANIQHKNEDSLDQIENKFIRRNQPVPRDALVYTDSSQLFYSLTSNILLSYFLQDFFHGIQTFYDDIFEEIEEIEFTDYKMIKETLIPFKRLCTALNLDSERLDAIIERISHTFFNKHKGDGSGVDYLYSFIDESVHFLSEVTQFSNELDELLAMRVDKLLQDYFYSNRNEEAATFKKLKGEVMGVLQHLKKKENFYATKNYEIENVIYSTEEKFVNMKVKEMLQNKQIKAMVKQIISVKDFMDDKAQRKVLRKIINEMTPQYTGDDLILFEDTIRRNFSELGGLRTKVHPKQE